MCDWRTPLSALKNPVPIIVAAEPDGIASGDRRRSSAGRCGLAIGAYERLLPGDPVSPR
jgi:hypothetical protein